eukprot:265611-Hanusia_phi.AAC.2
MESICSFVPQSFILVRRIDTSERRKLGWNLQGRGVCRSAVIFACFSKCSRMKAGRASLSTKPAGIPLMTRSSSSKKVAADGSMDMDISASACQWAPPVRGRGSSTLPPGARNTKRCVLDSFCLFAHRDHNSWDCCAGFSTPGAPLKRGPWDCCGGVFRGRPGPVVGQGVWWFQGMA